MQQHTKAWRMTMGRRRTILLRTYQKLATGGAGAIITGYVSVSPNGRTFPNMRMFDNDTYIPVYKSFNEQLKQFKVPIILQIAHGGSRSHAKITGQDVISCERS